MKPDSNSALIIVDMQNDFCPGGALEVREGNTIIPVLNKYIAIFEQQNLTIFYTADWHPPNHCSFKETGGIWPVHCVENTSGAAFHRDLKIVPNAHIIHKGTDPKKEAYSGFENTELNDILTNKAIHTLYIGGLATEYCVKNTAIDACHLGYKTIVLLSGIKGVELNPGDSARALKMMKDVGVTFLIEPVNV